MRNIWVAGDLRVDCEARTVTRDGVPLELPRLSFDVLEALIKAAPDALTTDDLMDRVWANKVVSPATVTKRIALLREALGDHSGDPGLIKSVRAYGYSLAVVPRLEESPVAPVSPPESTGMSRWLAVTLAAIVVLAGVVFAYLNTAPESAAPVEKSIAVLPFQALGDRPADQEFADGLTEEIMHSLSQTGALRVAGRVSSFRFAGTDAGPVAIGEALNVAYLLEGSVRQVGDEVRIVTQLVDTRDGIQRWSRSWERGPGDVITVQRDISEQVAEQLHVALTGNRQIASPTTESAEAYALYLRARSLMEYPYGSDVPRAQELLTRAVDLDPGFAEAWASLAGTHLMRTLWSEPTYELSPPESVAVARDAIDRALAASPEDGIALGALGALAWAVEDDIAKTARLIEQSVRRRPGDLGLLIYAADIARTLGDLEQARDIANYVLARDPLCEWCRVSLLTTLLAMEDYETLEYQARLAIQVTPQFPDNRYLEFFVGRALLFGGYPTAAAETFRQINEESSMRLAGLAMASHSLGDTLESDRYQEALMKEHSGNSGMTAQVAAWKGQHDHALELLDLWVASPNLRIRLQTNYLNPAFKTLHASPGWEQFLAAIGRAPEQIDDIHFDVLPYLDGADLQTL